MPYLPRKISDFSYRCILAGFAACCLTGACACQSVKPYQRTYLNDAAMQAGRSDAEHFSESAHTYREGASGGGTGKGSGGCGCN